MRAPPSAEEIFHSARALHDRIQRSRFLDDACGDDTGLRALVEDLLEADAEAGDFLRPAAGAPAPALAAEPVIRDRPGDVFGRYTVLQQIGEGGFGVVYMAEQREPVRRRVALKVIKLGMDTHQVIGRFEAERQALAMMDHPNIATVLDAGSTEAGRLYFVMEYINGVSIVEYCEAAGFGTRERLELFMRVCRAIQHAHQKGIIHRDIKPSNVLITLHDGVPVPKVIDFGIAKATSAELTARTFFTEHRQMIGTPAYMSPEQAEMSGLDIDTRSDIYSLGVLLYELLTSTTPFDSKELMREGLAEMLRTIREVEPQAPSTRLSSLSKAVPGPAEQRPGSGSSRLSQSVAGELDCIVMKCLEKDRRRRYETASALAEDVRRYLDGRPILAVPPSQAYRFKKFVRRHRGLVLAGSAVLLTLVVGILGTTLGLLQARRARLDADRRADDAREASAAALWQRAVAQGAAYRASLFSASEALERGQVGAARQHLEAAPPELRGWEWRHLASRLDVTLRVHEHGSPIHGLHLAPDGASYYGVGPDPTRTVQRWDVETGLLLQTMPTDRPCVSSWLVGGGRRLVMQLEEEGGIGGALEAWDVERGIRLSSWPTTGGRVQAVSGSLAAVLSPDGLSLRDLATGSVRALLATPTGSADFWETDACFRPDGRRLAVEWSVGQVRLFDVESLEALSTFEVHDETISAMAFSPDGTRLASGSADGTVRVTDVAASPPRASSTLRGHFGNVHDVVFSPEGSLLASWGKDGTARAWDLRTGRATAVFETQSFGAGPTAFLLDGHALLTADDRGRIQVWDARAAESCTLRGHRSYVYSALISPDGARIYSGGWDGFTGRTGSLRIWDAASGELIAATGAPDGWVMAAALSPDGSRLALSSSDGERARVEILDTATGATTASIAGSAIPGIAPSILSLAFDPSGRRLAWIDPECRAVISDTRTGATLVSRSPPERGTEFPRLAWSPDGSTIAACRDDAGTLSLLHGTTLASIREWPLGTDGTDSNLAFSPDGRRVVTVANSGVARVWDVETGAMLSELAGGGSPLFCVAYSPDGRRIAIGGLDGSIRLWDAGSFDPVARLIGHEDYVFSLAWSTDSEVLVSGSGDHSVRIWETQAVGDRSQARRERRKLVAQVEPVVQRSFSALGDADRVVEAVRDDAALSAPARRVAVQLVLASAIGERSSAAPTPGTASAEGHGAPRPPDASGPARPPREEGRR